MKKQVLAYFCLLPLFIWSRGDISGQSGGYKKIKWEKEKIAPGLIWKSSHAILDDSVPQNINILSVNLNKRKISIQYEPGINIPVSKQASSANAIAAVNGGFFNIKNGGSVTYIRTGGKIVDDDTAKNWSRNANMTGSVLIKDGSEVILRGSMPDQWYNDHAEYDDVLVTGPLLVESGALAILPATSLVTTKHPRTAIGTRSNKKILLITLDGRTKEAAGMTLNELASLMIFLRCRDAVNLDGGGSTTMWIKDKPFSGVVNMPCDNKKFDHYGERAVSDIFIIK